MNKEQQADVASEAAVTDDTRSEVLASTSFSFIRASVKDEDGVVINPMDVRVLAQGATPAIPDAPPEVASEYASLSATERTSSRRPRQGPSSCKGRREPATSNDVLYGELSPTCAILCSCGARKSSRLTRVA